MRTGIRRSLFSALVFGVLSSGGAVLSDESSFRSPPTPTTVSPEAQVLLASPPETPFLDSSIKGPEEWAELNAWVDATAGPQIDQLIEATGVQVRVLDIAGVTVREVTPPKIAPEREDRLLIEFHGGGYVVLGGKSGITDAVLMGRAAATRTWAVDYRMAPEHPYPAAVEDGLAVYRAALETYDPSNIAMFGTSAGGGLATAVAIAARDEGLPLPAAIGLNTPWSDLTKTGDTYYTLDGLDRVLIRYDGMLEQMAEVYADGLDMKDPGLSPVYSDFESGFSPTILISGTRDLFLSNTVRQHRALRRAGVTAELHVFEGMWHGFRGIPESQEAVGEMEAFFAAQFEAADQSDG